MILAGRRINDGMGKFIAEQTVKHMIRNGSPVKGAQVNVLGLTFKENCPDIRNTRVIDVIHELQSYGIDVHVHDPVADAAEARHEYGLELETVGGTAARQRARGGGRAPRVRREAARRFHRPRSSMAAASST